MLNGCSTFDPIGFFTHPTSFDYSEMLIISALQVDVKLAGNFCGTTNFKPHLEIINRRSKHLKIYEQHLPNNKSTILIIGEIDKLINELVSKYETPTSKAYCHFKINTIVRAIDIAMYSLGKKEKV